MQGQVTSKDDQESNNVKAMSNGGRTTSKSRQRRSLTTQSSQSNSPVQECECYNIKIQKRLRHSLTRQQHQSGQQFKQGSSEFQTLCVAACSSRESSLTLEIIIGSGLRHKDNEHEDEHGTCRILQCSNAHTSGVKGPANQFKI